MKLYKYVPFNEKSTGIISDNTMKFSSVNEFNDPFDCVVNYDVDSSMEYVKKHRPDLLKKAGDLRGLSPAKRIQNKNVLLKKLERSMEKGIIASEISNSWGICSLSEDPLSILMWSHYADNHRGFIAEFDTSLPYLVEYPERTLTTWPIEYSTEMPKTHMGMRDFEGVKKQFLVKALEWKYEREHRCLAHQSGHGVHSFKPEILTRIIAGAKIASEHYEELKLLVTEYNTQHELNVVLCSVELSKSSYELKFV